MATVVVREANNVVLAGVGAQLHLDDHKFFIVQIRDAVLRTDRYVEAVASRQDDLFVIDRARRSAADDNPVLVAVLVGVGVHELARVVSPSSALEPKHLVSIPPVSALTDSLAWPALDTLLRADVWLVAGTVAAVASIEQVATYQDPALLRRAWRLPVAADGSLSAAEILETGRADYQNPTTGTFADGDFYYLANPRSRHGEPLRLLRLPLARS